MIEIRVVGTPGPQGSKRHVGNGRMIESSDKVKPWREAVRWAVIEGRNQGRYPAIALTGAIAVEMTFTLARPKSAKRGALPTKKPDVSKLVRSTEDALTDVGLWEDDARVVHEISGKRYPNEGSNAMPVPGCVIRVRQISSVVDLEALAA